MGALDWFRIVAALFVVAIHTSPLKGISFWGDLTVALIVGRVAVPFFFMVSGYFVLGAARDESYESRIRHFLIKNLKYYLLAIVIYLPINWYAGRLSGLKAGTIVKELLIQGTFYHLWYLPALITGMLLSLLLIRLLGQRKALAAAAALYLFGLLGDSYYGLAVKLPLLKTIYEAVFGLMENTRNGLFLAPLFLLMGAAFRERADQRITPAKCDGGRDFLMWGIGLAVSLAFMTAEGLLVHMADWPHHDSMYLFLPVVMVFLFGTLLRLPAAGRPRLRSMSLWIYLLHPAFIVVVRAFAGITGTEGVLVENNLIHFLCVSAASVVTAYVLTLFTDLFRQKVKPVKKTAVKPDMEDRGMSRAAETAEAVRKESSDREGSVEMESDERELHMEEKQEETLRPLQGSRAWIEVDGGALINNLNQFRQLLSAGSRIMAIVKADGYGHGAVWAARTLQAEGVTDFAVATASEGIQLRQAGIPGNILILGYTNPKDWDQVVEYDLIQTIVDESYAAAMSRFGSEKTPLRGHLAVDTGMHRLGMAWDDTAAWKRIFQLPGLRIEGVFSHLCVADSRTESDIAYTRQQISRFEQVKKQMIKLAKENGQECPRFHLQSSFGFLNYPELKYDWIRPGISLYGAYASGADIPQIEPGLRPVMSVRARVAMVRTVEPGAELGYGRTYRAEAVSRIATVTIGYADGIPRNYGGGQSQVLIHGKRCPVVGRICMDQLLVDVTAIGRESREEAVQAGDIVTLIGADGQERITVEEVAGWCGTITNELLCRMGGRLERLERTE